MKATVYRSEDIDSTDAIAEILAASAGDWDDRPPAAGLLFSGIEHDFGVLTAAVLDRWPDLHLLGASTDGEIASPSGMSEDAVVLVLVDSDRVRMRVGAGRGVRGNPEAAVREALDAASHGDVSDVRLCIVTMEGIQPPAGTVVELLQRALPAGAVVAGGMAGEKNRLERTVQTVGREVLEDSVVVMLFSGPLTVATATGHGWMPVGTTHVATRMAGPLLAEIDHRPAVELYNRYLGGHSLFHPLAVYPDSSEDFHIVTTLQATEDGSLLTANFLPEGARVRLADAHPEEIIASGRRVCTEAVEAFGPRRPDLGLVFSCTGRRVILGSRIGEEVDLLTTTIGGDVPIGGFYAYGEICPPRDREESRVHNLTLTFVLLGEE